MATRRERVVLDLEDNFTAGVARAAAAAKVLDRSLNDLDGSGTRASKGLDESAKSSERLGDSSRKAGPEIDRMSGRLRLLGEAALVLGPALVPIGGAAIPVLTAAMSGLGAAAGAIGTTVLAFNGLGDALKSIDEAQAEPTAENLQKMRVELEKLGPAGADFARYLNDLRPIIDDLQNSARSGIFPGLEDGIDALLSRGPQVERIISTLAEGMGNIARDTGRGLASEEWTPFFDYVEQTAKPTLEAFAQASGNVALGVANLLIAFDPLSQGFTSGLVDATQAFADWSAELDSNESFQAFLDYIRESGPQVVDFLAALAQAFSGLIQAMAPMGQVVLPALTGVAKAFAAIASSPIGPGLYTAAAALTLFNRSAVIAEKTSSRFSATWAKMSRGQVAAGGIGGLALLASSLTDVDEKAGLANASLYGSAGLMVGGPVGGGIGLTLGALLDVKAASDDFADSIEHANDVMRSTDISSMRTELERLREEYEETQEVLNPEGFFDKVKSAAAGSGLIGTAFLGVTDAGARNTSRAIDEVKDSMQQGGDAADLFGETIGQTGDQLRTAAGDAQAFSGALAELNGWFDKRAAVRGYRDAVDELRKSIKDGFTREDADNLDNIGRSILQVAEQIKSPKIRGNFLEGARASLEGLAKDGGPKAEKAVQRVIAKMDELGLTHPEPKITADDKRARAKVDALKNDLTIMGRSITEPKIDANDGAAKRTVSGVKGLLSALDATKTNPKVSVDPGNSLSLLGQIQARLAAIRSKSVTVTVNQRGGGSVTSSSGGHSSPPAGEGAPDPGRRAPRISGRGAVDLPLLATDIYTSARGSSAAQAKAEMYRSQTAASTSEQTAATNETTAAVKHLGAAAWHASDAVKAWHERIIEAQQKVVDAAKERLAEIKSRRDEISSGIQSGLGGDIWGASTGSVWAAGAHGANSPQAALAALQEQKARAQRLIAAINTLKAKGITGPVLAEIIGSGDVERAEAMAALDVGTLSGFASTFNDTQSALAAAGLAGGNAVVGAENVRRLERHYAEELAELREIKQAIKAADSNNQSANQQASANFVAGVNGAASGGKRRGKK